MKKSLTKIFKRMQKLDRRYIFIVVALAIIIPLLIPFNSKTYVTEPTANIYKKIDTFSGKDDRAVLLCFSHNASTMAELFPMEIAVLRHCFERDVKVFTLCFFPQAAPIITYAINTAKEEYDVKPGIDYLNFGFRPAALMVPTMLGMGVDITETLETDAEGRKLDNLPIMKNIVNYNEMNLVVDFSGSASIQSWITYARAKYGANLAAGITAVMVADNYPFLQTGQILGMMRGMKGAAEYEKLVDVFAKKDKSYSKERVKETTVPITGDTVKYEFKKARIGMNAQSVAHIMIIVFIILGNIGYFLTQKGKKKIK